MSLKNASPLSLWLVTGWVGFVFIPWYAQSGGLLDPAWLLAWDRQSAAPGLQQGLLHGRLWLLPLVLPLLAPLVLLGRRQDTPAAANLLIACGAIGTLYIVAQGFLIIHRGWGFEFLNAWFGPLDVHQYGIGTGAALTLLALLMLFAQGIAARGAVNGDRFVVGSITLIVALVAAFIFFPLARILTGALQAADGSFAPVV